MFGISLFSPSGSFIYICHFAAIVYLHNDLSALAEVPTVLKHKQLISLKDIHSLQ